MNQLHSLLATQAKIDAELDQIDPAELDRAIEALETLRTLHSARRSARERNENGKLTSQTISLATMTADPATAREKAECEREVGERHRLNQIEQAEHNRTTVIEWLRAHQPASIEDISLATRIKPPAVRYIVAESTLCAHDASTPYRYSLIDQQEHSPAA